MIGQKFNRLTVIQSYVSDKYGNIQWLCKCDCGNEKVVTSSKLKSGHTKSCGCFSRENGRKQFTTHGMVGTVVYKTWENMKKRCTNPNVPNYERYGGRGIKVCDRWLNSFENFYSDMGDLPFEKAQIDRIDNNGDYSPENCRWVSAKENSRNKRNNRKHTFNGETLCLIEWSERTGINYWTLKGRVNKRGYTIERALSEPIGNPNGRENQHQRRRHKDAVTA